MAPQFRVLTSESAFCKETLLVTLQLITAETGTHHGSQELGREVCPWGGSGVCMDSDLQLCTSGGPGEDETLVNTAHREQLHSKEIETPHLPMYEQQWA